MKTGQKIAAAVLLVSLAATIYGMIRTGQQARVLEATSKGKYAGSAEEPTVDEKPLQTARRLVQMPTDESEVRIAQDVMRLADHEMDLAFAAALLEAQTHPPVLSAEAKEIQTRLQKAEDALQGDKTRADQLTATEAKANGAKKDALDDQLEEAKAQVELSQDEVDDAKQDLMRAGGDTQGRMEALVQAHDAASQLADTTKVQATGAVDARGLIHRYQQWSALHRKQMLLWEAKQDAESAAALFVSKHNELDSRIGAEKGRAAPPAAATAGTAPASAGTQVTSDRDASAALVKATRRRAGERKALTNFDKRIDDQKQLAVAYDNWISVVAAEQRAVINGALRGLLVILGIALVAVFFDSWIERLLGKLSLDRRQVETLRTVTRVTLQVIAVLLILLVIFGPPQQLGTFLGLAGAGLTVALKDFIVGFIGWFVLMGKNGIRLGDWVEINGVTGEVVELGMFHTVLLETGNWTDSGHPTGRRVTFTNSFAIEGHYFNFSTSGQWLWDELQIVLPMGQDPYPVVDAIQKAVVAATSETSRLAEQEWKSAARSRDMSAMTAAPAINIKPVVGGVEISVRYITRANERYQLRAKLYQSAVELLGQKRGALPPAEVVTVKPA